jgi:hypothetical protein
MGIEEFERMRLFSTALVNRALTKSAQIFIKSVAWHLICFLSWVWFLCGVCPRLILVIFGLMGLGINAFKDLDNCWCFGVSGRF